MQYEEPVRARAARSVGSIPDTRRAHDRTQTQGARRHARKQSGADLRRSRALVRRARRRRAPRRLGARRARRQQGHAGGHPDAQQPGLSALRLRGLAAGRDRRADQHPLPQRRARLRARAMPTSACCSWRRASCATTTCACSSSSARSWRRARPPLRSTRSPACATSICHGYDMPAGAIAWEDFLASGEPDSTPWSVASLDAVAPTDDAAIFFTSGSTAAPKGVVHTHASMLQAADNVADRLGLDADDRTYGYLPLFFNGGMVGVALATLSRGGAVLLAGSVRRRRDAGACSSATRCTTCSPGRIRSRRCSATRNSTATASAIRKGPGANTKWAPALLPPGSPGGRHLGHERDRTDGVVDALGRSGCADRAGAHGRPMPGLELRIVDADTNRAAAGRRRGRDRRARQQPDAHLLQARSRPSASTPRASSTPATAGASTHAAGCISSGASRT